MNTFVSTEEKNNIIISTQNNKIKLPTNNHKIFTSFFHKIKFTSVRNENAVRFLKYLFNAGFEMKPRNSQVPKQYEKFMTV